jgi:hypothetical protein
MNRRPTDLKAMRRALRALPRGNLLIIAERATELLPKGKLKALLADFVPLSEVATTTSSPLASIFDDVRTFHAAGLGGEYYEEFDVHSKNVSEKSKGTDAFIAEFDRLTRQCIRAAKTAPQLAVREAIELLLDLLRQIDKGNDEIIFFADDGGSWDIGVDWGTVFPAYFRCLAETASAEVFAQVVDQVIMDFADYQRPQHWRTAHRVADVAQKAALRAVTVVRGDRV